MPAVLGLTEKEAELRTKARLSLPVLAVVKGYVNILYWLVNSYWAIPCQWERKIFLESQIVPAILTVPPVRFLCLTCILTFVSQTI